MKYGGAHPDERSSQQERRKRQRHGQQQQTYESTNHAERQGVGHGPAVSILADKRLQDRCRHLEREGQQTDLTEVQMKLSFENGVDRWQQRLHRVIQEMAKAHCQNDAKNGLVFNRGLGNRGLGNRGLGLNLSIVIDLCTHVCGAQFSLSLNAIALRGGSLA